MTRSDPKSRSDSMTRTDRRLAPSPVPLHSLFGESTNVGVDFVHVERLHTRSERYDWSINAHVHDGLAQAMVLLGGRLTARLDDAAVHVVGPAAITTPSGVVHGFDIDPDSSGFVVTVADAWLDAASIGTWLRERLFTRGVVLHLGHSTAERLDRLCEEALTEHDASDAERPYVLESLIAVVFTHLARVAGDGSAGVEGRRDHLVEFRAAVDAHFADHWAVRDYAALLHMSESSLNRICRAATGRSAFEIAQDRLELEARRHLVYTSTPIQRVATELGFVDPSYFARFFRRRTGMSPQEFRELRRT